jgi:hypothetical protein
LKRYDAQSYRFFKREGIRRSVLTDPRELTLAGLLRARGKERRDQIWFRDADVAEAIDAILLVGLLPEW